MRNYEVCDVILDPSLDERTVRAVARQVPERRPRSTARRTVEADVDVWGKRRLAYEIKKNAEGIYAIIKLTAAPATVDELDQPLSLTLNESVLRTKVPRPTV